MRENKLKVQTSVGRVMANVFWANEGILFEEFLKKGATFNAEWYASHQKGITKSTVKPNRKANAVIFPTKKIYGPIYENGYWRININQDIYSFIQSTGMCRMRRFLADLRRFFHSSMLRTFSCHPSPPTILPSYLTSSYIYFLVYLSIVLFPNSYITLFWEFYYLPFSVHAQTNVIYLTLMSRVIVGFLNLA
jgi:hypothetical protein